VDSLDPDIVYAGTAESGVFWSGDGGATWTDRGLVGAVRAFALDSRRPGTVYALPPFRGLFKSTDDGVTWVRIWAGAGLLNGNTILQTALALDSRAGVLYVGTSAGLYRSNDGGITWKPSGGGLLGPVEALALDSSGTLYAATRANLVFKSTDRGATWSRASNGLARASVLALAVDPERSWNLLAGTTLGLYRSTNSGRSWQPAGGPAQRVGAVVFQKGRQAYAGYDAAPWILRSNDGGATWQSAGAWSGGSVHALAAAPGAVYAGWMGGTRIEDGGGISRSLDAGAHWEPAERGLHALKVTAVAVDPSDSRIVYTASGRFFYSSLDGGASWRRRDLGAVGSDGIASEILIDPAQPATLWVPFAGRLLRSDDAGVSWQAFSRPSAYASYYLALDPRAPEALWWTGRTGVHHSSDEGLTWELRPVETPVIPFEFTEFYDAEVDPGDPDVIYLAGSNAQGFSTFYFQPRLYRSADGGVTWERRDSGLPSPGGILDMAVDPVDPATLYAVVGQLYRSTDAGLSWHPLPGARGTSFSGLATAPAGPGLPPAVYALRQFPSPAVLQSTDHGETWTVLRRGLRSFSPSILAVDPGDPAHLLLGTGNGGLFSYTVPD
jgi:photosystem II stability/assembly factor-like uncharacterized protein